MTLHDRITDWTSTNITKQRMPRTDPFDAAFMTNADKAVIIRNAMGNAKGDDLERAESSFRHLTENQLDEEFGRSGKTKREIRDAYRESRARWQSANDLLEALLRSKGL